MKRNTLVTLQTALGHQQAGRFEEADTLCRTVLEAEPGNGEALNLLGVLEYQRGRHAEAVGWLSKAIEASGRVPEYHNNLGLARVALGQLAEAASCFGAAARLRPEFHQAHFNLGVVLQNLDQLEPAIEAYRKALALKRDPDTLNNLGVAYRKSRHLSKAIRCFEEALRGKAAFADALLNLASTLQESGQAQAAIPYFERRARMPDPPPDLAFQLGRALQQCRHLADAEHWYRQALRTQPTPLVCLNLAVMLEQRLAYDEAEQFSRQALELQPDNVEAWTHLGKVLLGAGRAGEALAALEQAIKLKPDSAGARFHRAEARLALGDFAGGWAEYEYRWQWKGFSFQRLRLAQPEWTGDDLHGRTLLVYPEQTLSDTLQFGRYLKVVAARGGRVLFVCPKELKSLFRELSGPFQVVDSSQPILAADVQTSLMSLPRLCGTELANIPRDVPYLPGPPATLFPLPFSAPGRLRVGITWAGDDGHPQDKLRSLPLNEWAPLLRTEHCAFFSLQLPPRAADLVALPAGLKVEDLGSRLRDFAETAAALGQLDLVISADTATLHLAGALGRPVWALLPFAPHWRWLLQREDSPWYPTMRLFRQSAPGDWAGVLARVQPELDRLARQRQAETVPKPDAAAPSDTSATQHSTHQGGGI